VDCQEPDCSRRRYARGWCGMHYKRWLRTGSPTRGERRHDCAVAGCDRQAKSRGWCHAHYQRWRTHGDVLGRPLHEDEVVHHVNGDRTDNRAANLELWSTAHPRGQRIADKVEHAVGMLRRYAPHLLTDADRPLDDEDRPRGVGPRGGP
jgi:hypothetical protein